MLALTCGCPRRGTYGHGHLLKTGATIPGISILGAMIHPFGNRQRHEPLSDGRPSTLLGRFVSQSERERRQAQVVTSAKGRSVAKNLAGPVRLGGQSEERQLLQSPIPSPASQARSEESHLRRRRLDADRYLPHAEGRNRTSRSRRRPLRPS